ncbi:MAG: FecR domain-containing protein [Leptospiraceae bacterium]|nr:FecR domain-containing protein [Leptospiraceae bacterium]
MKKAITILQIFMMLVYLGYCKQASDKQKEKITMLITYSTGEVKVIRKDTKGNETVLPAKVGMLVYENDIIRTENGKIDLQMKTGSVIRIKEMTEISIASLATQAGGDNKLVVDHGSVIASVKRSSDKEGFKIATPTAIAGVRGTVFVVEVDPFEKTSSVQVVEGKVALKPRILALEKASADEIQKKSELATLKRLEENEIVIEKNQAGRLNPEIERKIVKVNEKVEKAENIEVVLKEKEVQELAKVEPQKVAEVKAFEPSQELLIEKETLVRLNTEEFSQVEQGKDVDKILQQKEQEMKLKQEEILKKIEEEASKKELKTEKEIQRHYNKLEIITLHDGRKITGAVIAQTDDILVIHTAKGIIRVKKEEVESQEFK